MGLFIKEGARIFTRRLYHEEASSRLHPPSTRLSPHHPRPTLLILPVRQRLLKKRARQVLILRYKKTSAHPQPPDVRERRNLRHELVQEESRLQIAQFGVESFREEPLQAFNQVLLLFLGEW